MIPSRLALQKTSGGLWDSSLRAGASACAALLFVAFGRGRVARRVRGGYDAGEEVHLNLPEGCIIGDLTEGCVEHWATACATGRSLGVRRVRQVRRWSWAF